MGTRKRKLGLLVAGIVLLCAVAAALAVFLPQRPVLEADRTYTLVRAEYWPDGYGSRQACPVEGQEAAILDCLAGYEKQCSTELLFHREGDAIPIPDWPKLMVEVRDDQGTPYTYLVGGTQSQQREAGVSPPAYTLSGEGALWQELSALLDLSQEANA